MVKKHLIKSLPRFGTYFPNIVFSRDMTVLENVLVGFYQISNLQISFCISFAFAPKNYSSEEELKQKLWNCRRYLQFGWWGRYTCEKAWTTTSFGSVDALATEPKILSLMNQLRVWTHRNGWRLTAQIQKKTSDYHHLEVEHDIVWSWMLLNVFMFWSARTLDCRRTPDEIKITNALWRPREVRSIMAMLVKISQLNMDRSKQKTSLWS